MTSRAEYIGMKIQARKQMNERLVMLRKILAVEQDHATDPNQDEEERRMSAEAIPETEVLIKQAEGHLRTLGEMK